MQNLQIQGIQNPFEKRNLLSKAIFLFSYWFDYRLLCQVKILPRQTEWASWEDYLCENGCKEIFGRDSLQVLQREQCSFRKWLVVTYYSLHRVFVSYAQMKRDHQKVVSDLSKVRGFRQMLTFFNGRECANRSIGRQFIGGGKLLASAAI